MEETIKDEKIDLIRTIVTKLPAKYQVLVRLRYFQELSYEEIAEQMNLPLGTVKAQLFRARTFLAEMMGTSKDTI